MKIKSGFCLREICGENIVVDEGGENIDFSKIISLNESAALMWRAVIDREFVEDDLLRVLLDEYDVDESTAREDVRKMLEEWSREGLLA